MFKRIVLSACLAGLIAGLILTAVQMVQVVPLILEAETYEGGEPTALTGHIHAAHGHPHEEGTPQDGIIVRAAKERIESCEAAFGPGYARKDTLLMVVGRGASDSDANSNVCKVTRMLWEGMGFGWAETSYSGVTAPRVADALERAHGLGFRQVIVFPYFLFTGRLVKRIYADADAYQARHPQPQVKVVKAPYLSDHPMVLEAFVERMHEAEHGDGRMNCQLCQYREQIIGFEHRHGAPQVGHHHHVRGTGTDADDHRHDGHHHPHHDHHGHHQHHDHEHGA